MEEYRHWPLRERLVLAVDTSDEHEAVRLVNLATDSGARVVKFGLELASLMGWQGCAQLAEDHNLSWIADAKYHDISNTVVNAISNLVERTAKPPLGITVHAQAGIETLRLAQESAGGGIVFGVTLLTDIPSSETMYRFGLNRLELVSKLALEVAAAGLKGIVTSPREVVSIRSNSTTSQLVTLVPGARSLNTANHDQVNYDTPANAIRNGADLLVIGRQISRADNPAVAYESLVREIEADLGKQTDS